MSVARVRNLIEAQKLYFADPASFNDPFDMHWGLINFSTTLEQKLHWIKANMPEIGKLELKEFLRPKKKDKSYLDISGREELKDMRKKVGVCCFSEKSHDLLLWGHYADSHKGICLGFNIDPMHVDDEIFFSIARVKYLEKIIPFISTADELNIIPNWIYTKSAIWSYEAEVRALIKDRKGANFFEFSKACLVEIYYGCNTPMNEIKEITSLLRINKYKVKSFKMVVDERNFRLNSEYL